MKRASFVATIATAAIISGSLLVAGAGATGDAHMLRLHAVFHVTWKADACPKGSPLSASCYLNSGHGRVPGLGAVSERYNQLVLNGNSNCASSHFTSVFTVAGKGTINFAVRTKGCLSPTSTNLEALYTVTGGSGAYVRASGSGTLMSVGNETAPGHGTASDTYTGTLTIRD